MGSSKKHKEKDRERSHKKKHRHRSRSRSREKKSKRHDKEERPHRHDEKHLERHDDRHADRHDDRGDRHVERHDDRGDRHVERHDDRGDRHVERHDDHGDRHAERHDDRGIRHVERHDDRGDRYHERHADRQAVKHHDDAPTEVSGGGDLSLSIHETNALRAKLGLKPLEEPGAEKSEDQILTATDRPDVHKPAPNMAEVRQSENLRQKMALIKEKRKLNMKLGKVKTLGDSDSDEDTTLSWVKRSRKQQTEKDLAEKRAQMLEEMDEEFGIGGLIEKEFQPIKKKEISYDSKNLTGLEVRHAQESFKDGQSVILTLEDQEILGEDNVDRLVNVNMQDAERTEKNIQNKKKLPTYNPYDNTTVDEFGMLQQKEVLDKYDEDIYGSKKESFQLGKGGKYDATHERRMEEIKAEFKQAGETLTLPAPVIAGEFYSTDEMAKFKKVKKKVRKIRKKTLKASDLAPIDDDVTMETDFGSRDRGRGYQREEGEIDEPEVSQSIPGLDMQEKMKDNPMDEVDILGPDEDLSGIVIDDDAGLELEMALSKSRKLKKRDKPSAPEEELQKRGVSANISDFPDPSKHADSIVLNSTSEFCRALGEMPTYGMAGNRDEEEEEMMDFETDAAEAGGDPGLSGAGWQTVDIDTRPVDIDEKEGGGLEDEPTIDGGLASTLLLAKKKGFIEQEAGQKARRINLSAVLDDANYSIEDKRHEDLENKSRQRDRYTSGILSDFKELKNYKPEIKISYADENGRELNRKEAFRQLSHRFHGKGSGKRKTEKRGKKVAEENLMLSMSSTDTPLQTLKMLKDKQKAEKSAYVVLSGNKGFTGGTSLSKP